MHSTDAPPQDALTLRSHLDAALRRPGLWAVAALGLGSIAATFTLGDGAGATGFAFTLLAAMLQAPPARALLDRLFGPSIVDESADTSWKMTIPDQRRLTMELDRQLTRSLRYDEDMTLVTVSVGDGERLKLAAGLNGLAAAHRQVGETLERMTRTSDFIGRLDDGRYGVILTHCTELRAQRYVSRLQEAIKGTTLIVNGRSQPLQIALDVRCFQADPRRQRDAASLMAAALAVPQAPPTERTPLESDGAKLRQILFAESAQASTARGSR